MSPLFKEKELKTDIRFLYKKTELVSFVSVYILLKSLFIKRYKKIKGDKDNYIFAIKNYIFLSER